MISQTLAHPPHAAGVARLDTRTRFRRFSMGLATATVIAGVLAALVCMLESTAQLGGPDGLRLRTAVAVALAGASIFRWHVLGPRRGHALLAGVVAALGVFTLVSHVRAGWPAGHDALYGLIVGEPVTPGRLSLPGSIIVCLLGAALIGLHTGARAPFVEGCAVAGLGLSLLAMVGHVYHADELVTTLSGRASALLTALLLATACLSVLLARPDRGIVALVASDGPGGVMARGLIGPLVLIPLLAGHLSLLGWKAGWYDEAMAIALVVLTTVLAASVLVVWNAQALGRLQSRFEAAQQQLVQSQRIEAAGYLAGWICHELNNLLTVIQGNAELLCDRFADRDDPGVADLFAACREGSELTRKLLRFSGHEVTQRETVDLVRLIEDMRPTIESVIGPRIRVSTQFPERATVYGSWPQLRQLVMQPILNACDAMPDGGELELAIARVTSGAREMIALSFSDTGAGMDAAMQARAFEPFVTSKDRTRGTGLGLATVYGIVKAGGGTVTLRSAPGEGTVLTVLLPAA